MQKQKVRHVIGWQAQANYAGHIPSLVPLWRPQLHWHIDGLHPYRRQASQKKCCRKSLPVNLSVNLVWRLIDAEGLQEPGQLLVAKFPASHLHDQHFLGSVLPRCVGDFRAQLQRSSYFPLGRFWLVHWALAQGDNKGKKSQIGHIRPNHHFSVGAVPTRSHQQDF